MPSITVVQPANTPNEGRNAYNQNDANLNAEFLKVLYLNGSTPMTGILPMGGNRVTNMGAGIDPTDGVSFSQLQNEVNKRIVTNFYEVAPNYPQTDTTSHRFVSIEKALSAITDATTSNWYCLKVYPTIDRSTGYSTDLTTYSKNFVDNEGEDYPVVTITPDGGNNATVTQNGTIKGLKFKFQGHSSLPVHVKLDGGKYEDCVFVLGDMSHYADLILSNVAIHNCKLIVNSSNSISLDGTTSNFIQDCVLSSDIVVGSGVNEGVFNSLVPTVGNWV